MHAIRLLDFFHTRKIEVRERYEIEDMTLLKLLWEMRPVQQTSK